LINNTKFWGLLTAKLDITSLNGLAYTLALFGLLLFILSVMVFVIGQGRLLKPLLGFLAILSAVLGYFTQDLGTIFDAEMLRNMVDNVKEANTHEAMDLLSWSLIKHVTLLSAPPILLLAFTDIKPQTWLKDNAQRLLALLSIAVITGGFLYANYKYVIYFTRLNREIRSYITPVYAIASGIQLYHRLHKPAPVFKQIATDAKQQKLSTKPTIGIMAIGETARADHFALNGYDRPTNPALSQIADLITFKNASSCGTSTAFSVPCMFSFLNRADYTPDLANEQSNVIDALKLAGINVIWIENNSGCKGVCDRLPKADQRASSTGEEAQDNYLLQQLDEIIPTLKADTLIVLHMLGSHGPAYYKRYPADQATFTPYCSNNTPQNCESQQIINAYDNTILYTDKILAGIIERLQKVQANNESFMLYASDHGESLGENGVYLHALPYAIAPKAQTHIPMLWWMSPDYANARSLTVNQFKALQDKEVSHDFLSHTLLGAFNVQTSVYQPNLDLLKLK
jgi:lipid A ethanolaminephosphotransferase